MLGIPDEAGHRFRSKAMPCKKSPVLALKQPIIKNRDGMPRGVH